MIDINNLIQSLDLAEYGVQHAQAKGAQHAELFISSERSQRAQVEKGNTSLIQNVADSGAFMRLIKDGYLGSAVFTSLSKHGVVEAVETAIKLAKVKQTAQSGFPEPRGAQGIHVNVDSKLDHLQPEEIYEFSRTMIESVKESGPQVKATDGLFSSTITSIAIANSNGLSVADAGSKLLASMRTKVKKTVNWGSGYEYRVEPSLRYVEPEDIGRKSAELSMNSVKKRRIKPSDSTVILEPHAFADLIKSLLMQAALGVNLDKNISFLSGKQGSDVADANFNLYDEGFCHRGANRGYVDHEGTPTQRTPVIEKGVFKEALYDHASAARVGRTSTGNGVRFFLPVYDRLYRFIPTAEGTNLVVKNGDSTRDEMIEDTRDGLLVTFLVGSWSFNFTDGSFSAEARNCFKVERGEVVNAVDEATVSGNIMELIKELQIGSNPLQSRGYVPLTPSTVITPTVKAEHVRIGA
jgi:PmbA protein